MGRLGVVFGVALSLFPALAQAEVPFWHTLGQGGFLEAEAERFNALQSRYRLKPRFVGDYRELGLLLTAALRNGTQPPFLQVELSFLPVLARAGLLEPLTPPSMPLDPHLLALGRVGGKQWGLPLGVSFPVLYFNRSALEARGVSPPKTPEELFHAAKRLSSRASKGLLFSADLYSFSLLVLAQGGRLADGGEPWFQGGLPALRWLLGLGREGALQVRGYNELTQAALDFLRTKAFMAFGPSTLLPAVEARTDIPFPVGAVLFPTDPTGTLGASGAVFVLLKGASLQEKAAFQAFYAHLMDPVRQQDLAQGTHYIPLHVEAQATFFKTSVGRLLGNAKARLRPWHQDAPLVLWAGPLERALERVLKGGVAPERALEEAEREARTLTFP
ncbi:ABC-type sugar transport system, periplasmic component [Thermus oshimai JL-2]|uniref:ABC-type sugar transport system, periplasmic component n=1 Tax=Thermus oshimai JL-2 TaxID=751945 RepID=K7QTH9_THEOS|nr:extracellular solute-binding protein [Thermus oshimai]AFV75186.1 ABC-type sugar transport system, periplasmic component [Thermus oshimai JL-2]